MWVSQERLLRFKRVQDYQFSIKLQTIESEPWYLVSILTICQQSCDQWVNVVVVDQSILWTFSTKVAFCPASCAPSLIWFTNDNSKHTPLIFHLFRVKCNLNIMIWYQMNWKWISGNWMNPVKKRNLKQVAWGIICVWNDLRQFVRWPEYLLINVK